MVSLWKLSKCVVTCPESTAPQHFIASQRVTCTDEEGAEELLDCARAGEPEGISEMLARPGVHVDYQNEGGSSALHYAAANGHEDCVSLLLQKGARVMPNSSGNTPLHWAVLNKSAACVKALLNAPGTDVLAKNGFGRSALTEAFAAEQTDVTLSAFPSPPLCNPFSLLLAYVSSKPWHNVPLVRRDCRLVPLSLFCSESHLILRPVMSSRPAVMLEHLCSARSKPCGAIKNGFRH